MKKIVDVPKKIDSGLTLFVGLIGKCIVASTAILILALIWAAISAVVKWI